MWHYIYLAATMDSLLPVFIATMVIGTIAFKMFKNGGFKGAMFGAPILRTIGEIKLKKRGGVNRVARVYILGGSDSGSEIGIEILSKNLYSAHLTPISLSKDEARELAALLQKAVLER
jgi:hypothetical protein